MVGSVNEVVKKKLDATVGGLVWVQRKNGSWWPGQIVGEDELTETDLTVPRSGGNTPVKLLGRDDTSVEWYDLETTKTVKPFRCGEYDSCIDKARRSAASNALKKTRYPRRENAIVCALDIEKACMPKESANSEALLNCENDSVDLSHPTRDSDYSPEEVSSEETLSAYEGNSSSSQELSDSGISYEETNGTTHMKRQQLRGKKRKTPYDSEDDGCEGIKRMKGLSDLGIGSARKVQVLALPNPTPLTSPSLSDIRSANRVPVGTVANGSSMPTVKRKRSQVVNMHELLKRKSRHRPVTQVLENTALVPVRIICDEFANPFERSDAVSPSYDSEDGNNVNDVKLASWLLPEDDSEDNLVDVPFVDEEPRVTGSSLAWQSSLPTKPHIGAFRGNSSRSDHVQTSSFGLESLNESSPRLENGTSKWQSKGKRNARHLIKADEPCPKKKAELLDKPGAFMGDHEISGRLSPCSNGLVNGFTDRKNHCLASSQRSFTYSQSRFSVHSNFEMDDASPRSAYTDSLLYEVEVTVEATRHQVQHVPYISLRSKLNGKPITGHPLTVEALEDGYCDLQTSDYPASGSCELDDEDTEPESFVEPKPSPPKKFILKPKLRGRGRPRGRKGSKSKKKHGSSSLKKTRKLSSLTGPQKQSLMKGKSTVQTPKGPTLACVPIKIVFSRINEALNGSLRSAHRANNT